MFKHVLFRAAQTTINIFCLAAAPSPQRCQTLIEEYNQTAKPVWEQEDQELAERQRQCEEIHKSFFTRSFEPSCSDDIVPIPAHIAIKFDNIFRKYYCSSEKYLLFGRMDDDALEVQDNYGLEVATVLSEYKSRYGARAHLSLRKIYGRGAPLPLLSGASATAMWNACSSRYYQQQISTVSPTILCSSSDLSNPFVSFTPGSNPSRRSHPPKAADSNTPSTGSCNQS